jgi:glycosyltransferase involved in cell wall biosynthesis
MCRITVVMPTYNCMNYLPKAIDSVLKQEYENIELIVINDNSNDGTAEYLERLVMRDSRIIAITTEGVGVSSARNLGIKKASGEYITFLDSDDSWHDGKLKTQLGVHKLNPELGMSFTNYDHLTESNQKLVDCFGYWNQFQDCDEQAKILDDPLNVIFSNNLIGTSTVMMKKSVFKKVGLFDTKLKYAEDWQLWLKVCECFDVAVIPTVYANYLIRKGSITQLDDNKLSNLESIKNIISYYKSYESLITSKSISRAEARLNEEYADYYRAEGNKIKALLFSFRSFALEPKHRRIISFLAKVKKEWKPRKVKLFASKNI